jgi:hypothetical protein
MDPKVTHDPVFQDLVLNYETASRKLRESAIAMRSFYLQHHKKPQDQTTAEKWESSLLSENAAQRHIDVEKAAAQLLRYAYELAPHSNNEDHMSELEQLRLSHHARVEGKAGWGKPEMRPRGYEEQVVIDGGPPITIVIKPEHWDYTEKTKRIQKLKQPAIDPHSIDTPEDSSPSDVAS